jgi:hypothetical protein
MQIQTRIEKVREGLAAVKAHCMCLRFEETRTHYRAIYPDGYFPNGVQVDKRLGKHVALERMLIVMERHWKESFPCK